jgi:hypothetical protein
MSLPPPTVYYVYGFTQAEAAPGAGFGAGVDERSAPFLWRRGEIAVLLSLVAPGDFCGPEGEANLQNLEWLGPRACRHQAAIDQVMQTAPVLPARFGSLFSSLEHLEVFLSANAPGIRRFLEHTAGRDEWAVKGYVGRTRAEARMLARLQSAEGEPGGSSPGAAYLREQRLQIKAKRALVGWIEEASDGLMKKLDVLAVESCQRRLLLQAEPESESEMVLNWAFLVPRPALGDFRAMVAQADGQCRPDGLRFELSGPWPPYSFFPELVTGPPVAFG